jgi:hypothetical protein
MNLIKQYIVQCISNATNSLRLSTQMIEVVGLLKELIINSDNLESDLIRMKKITQFSTLAIRLNEIYNFLTQNQVEMQKLSDNFKEHSQLLIKDLNHMLEMVNPVSFKEAVSVLQEEKKHSTIEEINVDLSKRKSDDKTFENTEKEKVNKNIVTNKEKEDDIFFQNYESKILNPVKPLDNMLKNLGEGNTHNTEIPGFIETLNRNAELSTKAGFDIIANMHNIVSKALSLIENGKLQPEKFVIESMRACIIVIVAVVRGKEVDITNYLNKAENFGGSLENINIKEDN